MEALHLHQHPEEARVARRCRLGEHAAETPAPAYSSPQPSQRTDMLMSVACVSTPSSPNSRSRYGYVRSLWTMNPLSIGSTRPSGVSDVVGVRVAAQPRLGLVERDVVLALQHVGRGEAGDAGADDGHRAAGGIGAH